MYVQSTFTFSNKQIPFIGPHVNDPTHHQRTTLKILYCFDKGFTDIIKCKGGTHVLTESKIRRNGPKPHH